MSKVALNPRDLSALVPDGPVNRHCQVILYLDTDTGAVTGEAMIEHARANALDPSGNLPAEQLVGGTHTPPDVLDALRQEITDLRAQLAARDNPEQVS